MFSSVIERWPPIDLTINHQTNVIYYSMYRLYTLDIICFLLNDTLNMYDIIFYYT